MVAFSIACPAVPPAPASPPLHACAAFGRAARCRATIRQRRYQNLIYRTRLNFPDNGYAARRGNRGTVITGEWGAHAISSYDDHMESFLAYGVEGFRAGYACDLAEQCVSGRCKGETCA